MLDLGWSCCGGGGDLGVFGVCFFFFLVVICIVNWF